MNNVVSIIGMHRSGTSMVTNWLYSCGLNIGTDLLRGDYTNKKGHFEDLDFLNLHKQILEESGTHSSGLFLQEVPSLTHLQKEKIRELIKSKNADSHQWAWKDPRTCLFLDTYSDLIPDLKSLVILRNYKTVIQSLLKRDINRKRESDFGGIRGSVRWFFGRKKVIRSIIDENFTTYRDTTLLYFRNILKHVQNSNEQSTLVIDLDVLHSFDEEIVEYFTREWGFTLVWVPFDSVYEKRLGKNLMDIWHLIPDDAELAGIQKELESFKFRKG